MVQTRDTIIDGKSITVTQLPARRAIALQTKLLKLLGPSLGSLLSTEVPKNSNKEGAPKNSSKEDLLKVVGSANFSEAITLLTDKLDEQQFLLLLLECLQSTRVDNQEILNETAFDNIFSESLLFMYQVVFFSLKVNFEVFFGKGGIGSLMQKVKQTPTPPNSQNS